MTDTIDSETKDTEVKASPGKRVLIVATVASMIVHFNMANLQILRDMGCQVDVACNFRKGYTCSQEKITELIATLKRMNIGAYQIDFHRNPIHIFAAARAYRQLNHVLLRRAQSFIQRDGDDGSPYDFIHCHTPVGGIVGRIAAMRHNVKVIYTAHGFHFFKGAPRRNWLLFYPVEKLCSYWTDVLITINMEDYRLACARFHAKETFRIPGVGVDTDVFLNNTEDRIQIRQGLEILEDDFFILSTGELNKNKNHEVIIRAIAALKNPHIQYRICGQGSSENDLRKLICSLGLETQVKLLGFRQDIPALCHAADLFAFPSRREGLGLAAIEAMASGLPLVTSNVHGILDYAGNGKGAITCPPSSVDAFADAIGKLYADPELRVRMGEHNRKECLKYDISAANEAMRQIYDGMCHKLAAR